MSGTSASRRRVDPLLHAESRTARALHGINRGNEPLPIPPPNARPPIAFKLAAEPKVAIPGGDPAAIAAMAAARSHEKKRGSSAQRNVVDVYAKFLDSFVAKPHVLHPAKPAPTSDKKPPAKYYAPVILNAPGSEYPADACADALETFLMWNRVTFAPQWKRRRKELKQRHLLRYGDMLMEKQLIASQGVVPPVSARSARFKKFRSAIDLLEQLQVSLIVNLFPKGFSLGRFVNGNLIAYSAATRGFLRALDEGRVPADLLEDLPCHYYDGGIVVQIKDYRRGEQNTPEVRRVFLRPSQEALLNDVDMLLESASGGNGVNDDLRLMLEEKLIMRTSDPLCLDPTPTVARVMNVVHYNKQKYNTPDMLHWKLFPASTLGFGSAHHRTNRSILQKLSAQARAAVMQPSSRSSDRSRSGGSMFGRQGSTQIIPHVSKYTHASFTKPTVDIKGRPVMYAKYAHAPVPARPRAPSTQPPSQGQPFFPPPLQAEINQILERIYQGTGHNTPLPSSTLTLLALHRMHSERRKHANKSAMWSGPFVQLPPTKDVDGIHGHLVKRGYTPKALLQALKHGRPERAPPQSGKMWRSLKFRAQSATMVVLYVFDVYAAPGGTFVGVRRRGRSEEEVAAAEPFVFRMGNRQHMEQYVEQLKAIFGRERAVCIRDTEDSFKRGAMLSPSTAARTGATMPMSPSAVVLGGGGSSAAAAAAGGAAGSANGSSNNSSSTSSGTTITLPTDNTTALHITSIPQQGNAVVMGQKSSNGAEGSAGTSTGASAGGDGAASGGGGSEGTQAKETRRNKRKLDPEQREQELNDAAIAEQLQQDELGGTPKRRRTTKSGRRSRTRMR